jgi:hypothetical protein
MINPKDIEELAQKAVKFDEIAEYFHTIIKYRDGLMAHQTSGFKDKAVVISRKRFKRDKGELKYYTEEKVFVDSQKIDTTLSMAIQEELNKLNIIIDLLSKFINQNQSPNEDRNTSERENRKSDTTDGQTEA